MFDDDVVDDNARVWLQNVINTKLVALEGDKLGVGLYHESYHRIVSLENALRTERDIVLQYKRTKEALTLVEVYQQLFPERKEYYKEYLPYLTTEESKLETCLRERVMVDAVKNYGFPLNFKMAIPYKRCMTHEGVQTPGRLVQVFAQLADGVVVEGKKNRVHVYANKKKWWQVLKRPDCTIVCNKTLPPSLTVLYRDKTLAEKVFDTFLQLEEYGKNIVLLIDVRNKNDLEVLRACLEKGPYAAIAHSF